MFGQAVAGRIGPTLLRETGMRAGIAASLSGLLLLLTSCNAGEGRAPLQQPSAAGDAAPQRGGVFQMIGIRALVHLDPWYQQPTQNATFYLNGGVYDQLVDYDFRPDEDHRFTNKVVPELAEAWELRDKVVYTFSLRRNVKWHDGQPFTARDVKWSYEFVADSANKVAGGAPLKAIESISALDDHTVQIKLHEPDVDFLNQLTNQTILPKHVHDRGGSFETVAVGTGPFKVESLDPNAGVVYTASATYWKPGMPYVDKFKILPTADEAGRTAAFFAGLNDVLKAGAKPQAEVIVANNKEARLSPFFQQANVEMTLKLNRPPFNDLRVRPAMHLAVDRQAIIGTLTTGDGLMNPPALNAIYRSWALQPAEFEQMPGWRTPKDQDRTRAKQLLAEAGYGQGLSFTAKVDRSNPNWPAVAEVISAQLRQIGVEAKLQPMESTVYSKDILQGDYDAFVAGGSTTPASWFTKLHSRGPENTMPLRDPELDRLIEAQAQEFDEAKRAEKIREMQRLLLRQAYLIPTVTFPGYLLVQPWVNGFVDNRGANVSNPDWSQLWLDVARAPTNRLRRE